MTTAESFQGLANAIVIQAVKDYRRANRQLRRDPHNSDARKQKVKIERFFGSDWYKTLTDLKAEVLMKYLKKEEAMIDEELKKIRAKITLGLPLTAREEALWKLYGDKA